MDTDIRTLPIAETWELFISENNHERDWEETYQKARWGITISFDIYYYLHNYVSINPKKGLATIGMGQVQLERLWTEMEARNMELKKYLLAQEPDEPFQPRLGEPNINNGGVM